MRQSSRIELLSELVSEPADDRIFAARVDIAVNNKKTPRLLGLGVVRFDSVEPTLKASRGANNHDAADDAGGNDNRFGQ